VVGQECLGWGRSRVFDVKSVWGGVGQECLGWGRSRVFDVKSV
jgi:hypothetical protein